MPRNCPRIGVGFAEQRRLAAVELRSFELSYVSLKCTGTHTHIFDLDIYIIAFIGCEPISYKHTHTHARGQHESGSFP